MLDDLRNSATGGNEDEEGRQAPFAAPAHNRPAPFLGMSPVQRFILVVLLFMMTCVLGAGMLILFEKVYLPF
jgi:hypothetical protein